jgi:Mn-dependent DtxR family transcriptional regulator
MQKLGNKSAESTLEIVRKLFSQPIVGVAEIISWTKFSPQGAYNMIERLKKLGILELLGEEGYGQKYIYADYYEIFDDAFREARKKK